MPKKYREQEDIVRNEAKKQIHCIWCIWRRSGEACCLPQTKQQPWVRAVRLFLVCKIHSLCAKTWPAETLPVLLRTWIVWMWRTQRDCYYWGQNPIHVCKDKHKREPSVPGREEQVAGKWSWQKAKMDWSLQSGHSSRGWADSWQMGGIRCPAYIQVDHQMVPIGKIAGNAWW